MANDFAGLSETLIPAAERARSLGLSLTHFNSGARNSANGTRIFPTTTAWHQHFRGDHIAHFASLKEVQAFLDGYEACQKAAA